MEQLDHSHWQKLEEETRRVYKQNEVELENDYYHMPSAYFYPSLFAWDSGFQSTVMLHIDEDKAKRELETLFKQVACDGHLPHEVLFPCAATKRRPLRNFMRWISQWAYDRNKASFLIDPPIYVFAAELVYNKTNDTEWLKRIWNNLCSCLDFMIEKRDLLGQGMISILHPWEAGTDMSPQFFPAMGLDKTRSIHAIKSMLNTALLYLYCRLNSWDPDKLANRNRFVVEDLTVNSIAIRALRSASNLATTLGKETEADRYRSRAELMARCMNDLFWDDRSACYYPRWNAKEPVLAKIKTAASLLPVFAGICTGDRLERLVKEHILNEKEFRPEYLFPFNPHDELRDAKPWVEKRIWAGHCIWINFNWMISLGLSENGYINEARELTRKTALMILKQGFHEYYDSRDGTGMRVLDFTWPGLVLDMIARHYPEII
ncbi:MAG: hypothetical protein JW738_04730 [Actinobacteria bacterium]|nr:hypothetical protein [Actinomycetota bacterium]